MAFELSAAVYDQMSNPQKRLASEGKFLSTLVTDGCSVLDMACGTGVHAEFLAGLGAKVTACDLSESMIAVAKEKRAHESVTYLVRDMCKAPDDKFDFIYCIGNSLNMLPARADVVTVINNSKEALKPGGKLLLHLTNPECDFYKETVLVTKQIVIDDEKTTIVKTMAPCPDGILVTVSAARLGETFAEASKLLGLKHAELNEMLESFSKITWHGNMKPEDFDLATSRDLVVVAEV